MAITTQDLRGIFTKGVKTVMKERMAPTKMLQSMFRTKISNTSMVGTEVQQGTVKIAADIVRGADGNRNQATKSTEKLYEPQQFDEFIDVISTDVYKQLVVSNGTVSESQMINFIEKTAEDMLSCKDKIERSIEKMCSEVLISGVITSQSTANIDFKRKALSMIDLTAGSYWTDAVDPRTQIETWCNWLKENALLVDTEFDMIMGKATVSALRNNAAFKADADILAFAQYSNLTIPLMNGAGGIPLGYIIAGPYKINLFTYPQFYELENGNKVQYIDQTKVVLMPSSEKNFVLEYGAVPMHFTMPNGSVMPVPTEGDFHFYDQTSPNGKGYYMGVRSAPLPIPVAVNSIFTAKVIA